MTTLYLICFFLGLLFSVLAVFGGVGRLHLGHRLHLGALGSHAHTGHLHASPCASVSGVNGFTLAAFLCWFGGAGYLLRNHSGLLGLVVLTLAVLTGLAGALTIYAVLFKVLLPRERVLSPEDTRMDGVVARVSGAIRAGEGIGEILFTQTGARRGAPARSEGGVPIPRGTEVVVLRYERGIAWVSPLSEHLHTLSHPHDG